MTNASPRDTASLWQRLLQKTRQLFEASATTSEKSYEMNWEERLESLEEALFRADVDAKSIDALLEHLESERPTLITADDTTWKQAVLSFLASLASSVTDLPRLDLDEAFNQHEVVVLMLCGINGSGKTTTIAKLAHAFQSQFVFVVGGDTYRAAADAQLVAWCDRVQVPYYTQADVSSHGEGGASPATVAFQGVEAALRQYQAEANTTTQKCLVLLDTSGRLHVDAPLMEELAKVKRSVQKALAGTALNATLQTALVIDGTTGQNAIQQVKQFHEAVRVDGLICTKLDASAKGGALLAIARETGIATAYVTAGESVEAWHRFELRGYLASLLGA